MQSLHKWILATLLAVSLAIPLTTFALVPIGGKVVSVSPCPSNIPGYLISVVGFGIGSGVFWYVPGATLTYLYGPPLVGQWVLGMSDIPTTCGLRATFTGTGFGI